MRLEGGHANGRGRENVKGRAARRRRARAGVGDFMLVGGGGERRTRLVDGWDLDQRVRRRIEAGRESIASKW